MPSEEQLEALIEAEFRLCARNPIHFIETFCFIKHPSRGRIPFKLYDFQHSAVAAWLEQRHVLVLKARQIGCSTLVACFVLWFALFHPDKVILLLSKTEEDAKILLEKVILAYKGLPKWLRYRLSPDGKSEPLLTNNVEKAKFANGSVIDSLPATKDTGRGQSASLVVIDEWAFLPDPEKTWAAVEPTVDLGGKIIAISTANGTGNVFHTQWEAAESEAGMFHPLFFGWEATPERDESWYEAKKRDPTIPEWTLHQEYPRNAREAFIRSGNPYFDVDKLDAWVCKHAKARFEVRDDRLVPTIDGRLKVWAEPNPKDSYVIGVDTAEGLERGDFSSVHVLNRLGACVAVWHGRIDPDLLGSQVLYNVGLHYNAALIGVERNGSGLTTVSHLIRRGYPNVFFEHEVDKITNKQKRNFGWRTTRTTRPLMLDELGQAIREASIQVLDTPTRKELMSFVRGRDGRGEGSPHDDRVISLAIAIQMLKWIGAPEYQAPARAAYWSNAWWDELVSGEGSSSELQEVIGNERVREGA